ncbi:MAG: hypothetical protein QXT45_04580 [Candidatus Bilamarchaeaceae archaeon]
MNDDNMNTETDVWSTPSDVAAKKVFRLTMLAFGMPAFMLLANSIEKCRSNENVHNQTAKEKEARQKSGVGEKIGNIEHALLKTEKNSVAEVKQITKQEERWDKYYDFLNNVEQKNKKRKDQIDRATTMQRALQLKNR